MQKRLLVIDIIQTLVVEQRRDIILEVVLADKSAEDIAGFHEEIVQLLRCTYLFIGSSILFLSHDILLKTFNL